MVVSSTTTLFQIRRQRNNTGTYYIKLLFITLLLGMLAYLASRNAVLCVLLNFTVPFALVFFQSDQFAPKGYFGYAMTFVFLELRPPTPEEFPVQMLCLLFCTLVLIGALLLYARLSAPSTPPEEEITRGLTRLAELLEELAGGGGADGARRELEGLAQRFRRLGYARRSHFHLPDGQRRFYYLFALLFQRLSYLLADEDWGRLQAGPACGKVLVTLAGLVRQLQNAASPEARGALTERLQILLAEDALPQGRLRIFYRSFLHRLLLLLAEGEPRTRWPRVPWREVFASGRRRLNLNNFEVRFALRLAVVMTISTTVSLLWEFEHTYWFPLHAFLLLQPSYEESAHRMITRPVGTAIGCLVVHLVYPWLPGLTGVFAFALAMISLMYCCTPGSWVHPIFSTSFALALATLTVKEGQAIQLRLFYLLLAVALVLVVNRFLVPTRKATQFRHNLVPPPGLLLGAGAAQPPRARPAGALRRDSGLLSSGVPRGGPVCGGPAGGRGGAVPDGAAHPVEPVRPCGEGGVPGTDRGAGGGGVPCSEPPGRRNSGAAGPALARTGGVGAGRSAGLRGALPGHGALPA